MKPVQSVNVKEKCKIYWVVALSIGMKPTENGVCCQQSFENLSRALLTNLLVPAVYHCQIRNKLIIMARTSRADVYSMESVVKNKWMMADRSRTPPRPWDGRVRRHCISRVTKRLGPGERQRLDGNGIVV